MGESYLLLHCPTGHLSATVAGIVTGELPAGSVPASRELRRFFRRSLARRKFGSINGPLRPSSGAPSYLLMSRGGAGSVVDRAISQVPRLVAGAFQLQVGPALRTPGSGPSLGMLPTAPAGGTQPLLFFLLWWARLASQLGLYGLADILGSAAVRACYPQLVARARFLPAVSVAETGPSFAAATGGDCRPRAVYHCFGAAHSSIVAASLHLGILPERGPVRPRDLNSVAAFDRRSGNDIGRAVYVGTDHRGCEVFVIGFDGARGVITRAFLDLVRLTGGSPQVVFADTLNAVNLLVRIGGYLSRRLRVVSIGRPLAALGIAMSIERLREVVERTKRAVAPQGAVGEKAAGDIAVADHSAMDDNGA